LVHTIGLLAITPSTTWSNSPSRVDTDCALRNNRKFA
jgi:hypothetical protein